MVLYKKKLSLEKQIIQVEIYQLMFLGNWPKSTILENYYSNF